MRLVRVFLLEIAVIGIMLLIANMFGLFIPLRSPALANAGTFFGKNDLVLSQEEVLGLSKYSDGESTIDYVTRVTQAVNKGMAHDWPEDGSYNVRIPITENWILWIGSYVARGFQRWEYSDHQKALERGIGWCSQHAIVLAGLLKEQGVQAEIVSLGMMHVVNQVEISPNEWIIADSDYGVILPALKDITPEIIEPPIVHP